MKLEFKVAVVLKPRQRILRSYKSHGVEQRRTKRVDIRPAALGAPPLVLLKRCKTLFQYHGHAARPVLNIPRGTEIYQLNGAVRAQHYVVRRNVAVDNSALVQYLERRQQLLRYVDRLRRGDCAAGLGVAFQRSSVDELHRVIRRAIFAEHIVYPDKLGALRES